MKVLVVGSGGREHALVWKIAKSNAVTHVYCAPGNPGIEKIAECVNIDANDKEALLKFAIKNEVDLTVVGPEEPLVKGIVDDFQAQGLYIFGPTARAAKIEGSKAFAKYIMDKYSIPTADCIVFDDYDEARKYLSEIPYPTVLKADGLAAGKGVLICHSEDEAVAALNKLMKEKAFGDAGSQVIVEEFMVGEEASITAITDGEKIAYFSPAQDHKPIFDNDQGPNTGGMGAYAPAPIIDQAMHQRIHNEIMLPTIRAMAKEKRPYRGALYAGLMITDSGPKVVEFNCRFGDPETQVLLPLLDEDLVSLMRRVAEGQNTETKLKFHDGWAMCVVIVSGGYPGPYEKGVEIFGLDQPLLEHVYCFHAGTKTQDGKILTNGGRVLGITAQAENYHSASELAYLGVGKITFDKAYYRKDIGQKAKKYLY